MKEYRVTKYNPKNRDSKGSYLFEEWTSISDIGKNVTKSEYEKIECAYIDSALEFLEEQGISQLYIEGIENSSEIDEPNIQLNEGALLKESDLRVVMKSILREKYWAKLVNKNTYIHFGYDYYMYIGIPNEPKCSIGSAESRGLFVEEFASPYNENEL